MTSFPDLSSNSLILFSNQQLLSLEDIFLLILFYSIAESFNTGARINLYNFENAHKVGTYQKPDGSLEWIDNFTVRQDGYDKAING